MSPFLQLSKPTLLNLAIALEQVRFRLPLKSNSLNEFVPPAFREAVVAEINQLYYTGARGSHIAYTLKAIAAERSATQNERDKIDLVWTGHSIPSLESRDTNVVVRELFSAAQYNVLIASYALDTGARAQALFQELAMKMDRDSNLKVRIFLNINRKYQDARSNSELIREFAHLFRSQIWPGERLPNVYYDPRSLSLDWKDRSCLHAKCVVVDEEKLFITSANFTEAAHLRNIEAGVLVQDYQAAHTIVSLFENLVQQGLVKLII